MSVESTKRIGNLSFEIQVNGHQVLTDVPEKLGGEDTAPGPHDYVVTALAACTAITMQMYANRKGIPLMSSNIKVEITEEGAKNAIKREIALEGDLTEEQRQRLLEIAEKCPLHQFLQRGANITTSLLS